MRQVGLTGGIGSGKSTVARRLGALGAFVVDADSVAREVLAPGTPGLAAVVAEFGSGVLSPDGGLDRPALGALVFTAGAEAAARRKALDAIVHPLVRAHSAALVAGAGEPAVVVHDVPLLVESGLAPSYDVVVVVDASEQTRLDRLTRTRGMTEVEARARMAAQASREERLAVADVVVDNDGPVERLDAQVLVLWERLLGPAPRSVHQ